MMDGLAISQSPARADRIREAPITLSDGRRVCIRPLRRGETDLVRELFARLSVRTRYLRFFLSMPVVPDSLVRMLADVDDPRRLAFIGESEHAEGIDAVALGNVALERGLAEIGLVVADAWQRQGIGVALASRLLDAAEARGYDRFVIHGLSDNPALRPLLEHVAEIVSSSTRFGESEIIFRRRFDTTLIPNP